MNLLLMCVIGYFVGSIPTGFLLTKIYGQTDIRDIGSHSTGATNVLRSGHKILALLTLLGDAIKGTLFASFVTTFSDISYSLVPLFFCVVGHVFPIWLGFKGGKGVATSAGIFLALSPLFALISIFIWLIFAKLVKISSIASISLTFSFMTLCTYGYFFQQVPFMTLLFSICDFIFLMLTHSQNIKRILHNKEEKLEYNRNHQ